MNNVDQQKSQYQRACIVIVGDAMEDWRYVFRELKMRVGVIRNLQFAHIEASRAVEIMFRVSLFF